jgi:predicted HicB family RNase H-like nuclease
MDYLEYKGYKGTVEYCKDDDCLVGKVIGMHKDLIAYEGATLAELRMDFEAAVDSYIEGCLADGIEPRKPFSGKLILRMSSDLHGRVAMAASANGTTINEFITKTLATVVPQQ